MPNHAHLSRALHCSSLRFSTKEQQTAALSRHGDLPSQVLSLGNKTLMNRASHEGDDSDLLRLTPVNITTPDKARTTVRTPRMVE